MKGILQVTQQWSLLKKTLFYIALFIFLTSSFLFLTPPGGQIRQWLAETVITTQHRSWAWIFVGAQQRDLMVKKMQDDIEAASLEKQNLGLVSIHKRNGKARSIDELIKVEDISGPLWKGKKMYVYDPTTIKIMTPSKPGEGERITSMVKRTGAVAGVNGGAFDDPEGLGNGFAALGMIISGGDIIFTDQDGSIPQHIVGFTKEGRLVVGKYDAFELRDMGVSEAVSFYPRLIANGKPMITSGDGGWGRAPRSAVGQRADGTVIFVVIDGRQSHSVGATLKEVQDLLLQEGCVIAGNLDGGASSELVVDGQLITKPSSRYGERRLPSAFLVYDDPSTVQAPRVWDGIDKIDAGGSYDHPDFLREQAEKRAKGQSTTTTKPAAETKKPEPVKTGTDKAPSGSGTTGEAKPGPAAGGKTPAAGGSSGGGTGSSTGAEAPTREQQGTGVQAPSATNPEGSTAAPKPAGSGAAPPAGAAPAAKPSAPAPSAPDAGASAGKPSDTGGSAAKTQAAAPASAPAATSAAPVKTP